MLHKREAGVYFCMGMIILLLLAGCGGGGETINVEGTTVAVLVETEMASQAGAGQSAGEPAATQSPTEVEEASPPAGMMTYTNTTYGFTFTYPESWTVEEADHAVLLWQGNYYLRVNYRFTNENQIPPMFGRTGVGAGEFVDSGSVRFLGQTLTIRRLIGENKVKAVFYDREFAVDDLIFVITLEASGGVDYRQLDIPEAVQVEALAVLESFIRI